MQSILSIILPLTCLFCFLEYTNFSIEMNSTDLFIGQGKNM